MQSKNLKGVHVNVFRINNHGSFNWISGQKIAACKLLQGASWPEKNVVVLVLDEKSDSLNWGGFLIITKMGGEGEMGKPAIIKFRRLLDQQWTDPAPKKPSTLKMLEKIVANLKETSVFHTRNRWSLVEIFARIEPCCVKSLSFIFQLESTWRTYVRLMEKLLHQLRLVVYSTIYKVLYIPGGWDWDFWTTNSSFFGIAVNE